MRKARKIPFLVRDAKTGRWFWKPSPRLRPHWRSRPLGDDRAQAETEALRLNREVATWEARGGADAPSDPRRAGAKGKPSALDRAPPTVGRLVAAFLASADFKLLAPKTQETYRAEIRRIERDFGDVRVAAVSTQDVDEWLDELRVDRPEAARHLGARARALWNWGQRRGLAPLTNPWQKARLGGGGRRDVYTDLDGLRALVRAADRLGLHGLGTAAIIGFTAIARETDVLALRRDNLVKGDDGQIRLVYEQSKSRRRRSLKIVDPGVRIDVACPGAILTRLVTHPPAATAEGLLVTRLARRGRQARSLSPNDAARPLRVGDGVGWDIREASRAWRRIVAAAAQDSGRPELAAVQLRDMRRSGYLHAVHVAGVQIARAANLSGHSYRTAYELAETYAPRTAGAADMTVAAMKVEI